MVGPPLTALRTLPATRADASSAAASGRTTTPDTPRATPRTRPGMPPSSTPLGAGENFCQENFRERTISRTRTLTGSCSHVFH